jgi:hypothetical protein
MLKDLEKEGGCTYKAHTVLGTVMNYSEKQSTLLENISSLTSFDHHDHSMGMDIMLGMDKSKVRLIFVLIGCLFVVFFPPLL